MHHSKKHGKTTVQRKRAFRKIRHKLLSKQATQRHTVTSIGLLYICIETD